MSTFDDALDILATFKMAQKQADASLTEVGDQEVLDIPGASKVNALLLKGKNGARYRIDGLRVTREK